MEQNGTVDKFQRGKEWEKIGRGREPQSMLRA